MSYDIEKFKSKTERFRKTAYIRFDLSERLQVVNYINLVVSILLTVYLSGWAIFVAFFPDVLTSHERNVISYVSVMATIALMCLTLLDYTADRSVKSRAFLQCGNKVIKIADDLDFALEERRPLSEIKDLVHSYNRVLAESEWNHSGEDNALYEKKQLGRKSFLLSVKYNAAVLSYYLKRTLLQMVLAFMVLAATLFAVGRAFSSPL